MIKIDNTDINLKDTITCGQIFRFKENIDNSFTVILNDRVVNLKKDGDTLLVKSNDENNLEDVIRLYLDLDRDYNKINNELIKMDNSLNFIINSCIGFKIINQNRFETAISYILSQNNGVPQIRNCLNNISEKYGKRVEFEGEYYYLFPTLDEIKDCKMEDLRALKTGFRDKYLYEFINNLNNNKISLDFIENLSSQEAMQYLMKNNGIGEKVASCILLFSYSRFDVFPIDTWVKKYMKDEYNITNINDIRKFTKEKYGDYCGLIIQYMFHYKRNKEKE